MQNAPLLSDSFRATLAAVDTAAGGLGAAVADMLAVGHAEYLTFDQFRQAVKTGLSAGAWDTVTNYMAPMRRAWENKRTGEFCEIARTQGIKAALKLFPAGTGKRGAPAAPAEAEAPAPVITDATGDAIATATAKADAAIREAAQAFELDELRAENAALLAQIARLKAENAALIAELATAKAQAKPQAKPAKLAAAA